MSYAQTKYSNKMGNGILTIAEIGCLLTSIAILLTDRFGEPIDPPTLNDWFRNHNDYYYDSADRAYEDLGWSSISQFDPNIHSVNIVDHGKNQTAGWPSQNNAIVKFYYQSHRTGEWTTHFAPVADAANHMIIDPWDGVTKSINQTWYGQPVAYAEFVKTAPVPIAPIQPAAPAPAAQPSTQEPYKVEAIPSKEIQLKIDTCLWNLNDTTWSSFKENPVRHDSAGHHETVSAIAHHKLGGSYYMPDQNQAAGYNVIDCEDYVAPETPVVAAPSVEVVPAPVTAAPAPTVAAAIEETQVPVTVVPAKPDAWKVQFKKYLNPVKMEAAINVPIKDQDGLHPDRQLERTMTVLIAGEGMKDGEKYYRTLKSVENDIWYTIPAVVNGNATLRSADSEVDKALDVVLAHADDIRRGMGIFTKHEKNVKLGAKFAGSIDGFLHRKK